MTPHKTIKLPKADDKIQLLHTATTNMRSLINFHRFYTGAGQMACNAIKNSEVIMR
jgi:hypothetical protein